MIRIVLDQGLIPRSGAPTFPHYQRKARLRIARSLHDPIADDLVSSGAIG